GRTLRHDSRRPLLCSHGLGGVAAHYRHVLARLCQTSRQHPPALGRGGEQDRETVVSPILNAPARLAEGAARDTRSILARHRTLEMRPTTATQQRAGAACPRQPWAEAENLGGRRHD